MSNNANLRKADKVKNDEFYTSKQDAEKELSHYTQHFKGKRIYCNCDDPFESCFPQIFGLNFKKWGLESLTCTCYGTSKVAGTQMSLDDWDDGLTPIEKRRAYVFHIGKEEGQDINSLDDLKKALKRNTKRLEGNGDFRSEECLKMLDESDIVVTNPPFSLFREFIATLIEHDKRFLVIGNENAVACKELFPLIKDNKMWFGFNHVKEFVKPNGEIQKFGNIIWYTNLIHSKRNEKLILWKEYSSEEYLKFDWFDAINVDKVTEIPKDYDGIMGVPITFLDKYNPEQFEILDVTNRYTVLDYFGVNSEVQKVKSHCANVNGATKFPRVLIKRK